MKLISSSKHLTDEFIRLLKHYKAFKWSTAWAGIDSPVYKELCVQESKIDRIIIGIHFYQTHPDFIEKFLLNNSIKYIKQTNGTFHPKLYLFYNSPSDWELLVGSANFTKQAFSNNTEASILITSNDLNSKAILNQSNELIDACWRNSKIFVKEELENYRIMWAIQKPKIESLSGDIEGQHSTPFHQIPFMVMPWQRFIKKIKNEHNHSLKSRLDMLAIAKQLFLNKVHFSDFTNEERSFVAGIPYSYESLGFENWRCFGSMKGAGKFKNKIINNDELISMALDEIPLKGEVTEEQFNRYKNCFAKVFKGNSIGTFSRLLAMKRPDVFYCITSANKKKFCEGFKLTYANIKYDTYWELIVLKIRNSEWWLHPAPRSLQESKISDLRAAFLDAFCYQE